jgi:hypothetical protein
MKKIFPIAMLLILFSCSTTITNNRNSTINRIENNNQNKNMVNNSISSEDTEAKKIMLESSEKFIILEKPIIDGYNELNTKCIGSPFSSLINNLLDNCMQLSRNFTVSLNAFFPSVEQLVNDTVSKLNNVTNHETIQRYRNRTNLVIKVYSLEKERNILIMRFLEFLNRNKSNISIINEKLLIPSTSIRIEYDLLVKQMDDNLHELDKILNDIEKAYPS